MAVLHIALVSQVYAPSVGGIETVSQHLAHGLRSMGHTVTVITSTPGSAETNLVRCPTLSTLLRQFRDADIVLVSHFNLRMTWPLLIFRGWRPLLVVNHTALGATHPNRRQRALTWCKRTLQPAATYAASNFLATSTGARGVLRNPLDDWLTHAHRRNRPTFDGRLLFVGRLVPAKGLDILLAALTELRQDMSHVTLTVIGEGPCRDEYMATAARLGLREHVAFVGSQPRRDVQEAMAEHGMLVVPSIADPPEGFGMVALEGLQAGCRVVASDQGGLPEALGDLGYLCAPADAHALAGAIRRAADAPPPDDQAVALHVTAFSMQRCLDDYQSALLGHWRDHRAKRGPLTSLIKRRREAST